MSENNISIKDKSQTIKNFAHLSAQHCELIIKLFEFSQTGLKQPLEASFNSMQQTFRDIMKNAQTLYERRHPDSTAVSQTDIILIRNIVANFNRQSIEMINELSAMLSDESSAKLHMFIKHIAAEQKMFLEESYQLSHTQ